MTKKRPCKFGKVSRGRRKGSCRKRPLVRKRGGAAASALYGLGRRRR